MNYDFETTIILCFICIYLKERSAFIVFDTKQNEISSDFCLLFSRLFFFFSSAKKTKLNKANRELSKCQFSRASLEGLGPTGQHINTFLITKGKLSQFNIQFHCHAETFLAGVQEFWKFTAFSGCYRKV